LAKSKLLKEKASQHRLERSLDSDTTGYRLGVMHASKQIGEEDQVQAYSGLSSIHELSHSMANKSFCLEEAEENNKSASACGVWGLWLLQRTVVVPKRIHEMTNTMGSDKAK